MPNKIIPGLRKENNTVLMAAIPEAKATADFPLSNNAILFSNNLGVGLYLWYRHNHHFQRT